MSTLKVNAIQSNTTQSINVNSNLGNISNIEVSGVGTFSGGVVISSGSTSAPSISPSGDSNTGIFFPSPDTIAFAEGGVEALRIDSSANIGIGTTSPISALTIGNTLTGIYSGTTSQSFGIPEGTQVVIRDSGIDQTNNKFVGLSFVATGPGGATRNNYIGGVTSSSGQGLDFVIGRKSSNTTYSESFRITNTGNANIINGNLVFATAGTGIDFSATANSSGTMTSELLSDYEEGTWTPTFSATGASFTYNLQLGTYVKIGNTVFVTCMISPSSIAGASGVQLFVNGLPFAPKFVNSQNIFGINIARTNGWVTAPVGGQFFPTTIELYKYSGTNMIDLLCNDANNGCIVRFNGFYEV